MQTDRRSRGRLAKRHVKYIPTSNGTGKKTNKTYNIIQRYNNNNNNN